MKNITDNPALIEKYDEATNKGTSFFSDEVRTTVQQLSEKLGPPSYDCNDGSDKVNFEWQVLTDKGIPFTIYDWKRYRPLSNTEYVDFHIGARNKEESRICKESLIHFLAYGTDEQLG